MSAEELKAKGNAAFVAKKNEEAVNWFTQAIAIDPSNHILYSNRSAAYCADQKFGKALEDAVKVTDMKPDWAKGWSRKGAALHGMEKLAEAEAAYKEGLKYEPENAACKQGLQDCQRGGGAADNPMAKLFGPDMWVKIQTNPSLKPFLSDPEYVNKLKLLQANPQLMNSFMQDKRIMQTMMVLMGLPMDMAAGAGGDDAPPPPKREEPAKPKPAEKKKEEEVTLSAEEMEAKETREKSDKEKDLGNQCYKKREFDDAIAHYDRALELDPTNIPAMLNKTAVALEKGDYDSCLSMCDDYIDKVRGINNKDFKSIAKLIGRKGTVFHKQKKYKEAIAEYKRAQTENRTADILEKLNKAEKEMKEAEASAYLDPALAEEAKARGNELFKSHQFPEAIKEYTEATKRNPEEKTYWSNRAAAYMKLGEYNHAVKDCDAALKLDEDFVKAIVRKAQCYFFMKEYHKALEWYQKGARIEPGNQECRAGVEQTLHKINEGSHSSEVDEDRARRAMADPEIQAILKDPMMQMVLRDCSENPSAAQQHMSNPGVAAKIQKLIAAGVLSVK